MSHEAHDNHEGVGATKGTKTIIKTSEPFVSFVSLVVRSEIRCILLCILSMEVSKDGKPTYY